MEELFSYEDKFGAAVVVNAKGKSLGISTQSGTLCVLGVEQQIALYQALGEHLNKIAE